MKKILISLMTIALVGTVAFGASQAFFSDTEESTGNTITAGSIDLDVGTGEVSEFLPVTINDMKPSYVRWTRHVVKNVGNNPLKLWKHIKDVETSENGVNDPEQDWYNDHPDDKGKNDIDKYIEYDIYLGGEVSGDPQDNWLGGENTNGTVVISEDAGITVADIESIYVYLGELAANNEEEGGPDEIVVWQSYHMKDETENWAQTDTMSFTIEFFGQQVNGENPESAVHGGVGPQALLLENKDDTTWDPFIDGTWGVLSWAGDGDEFDFSTTLMAYGLTPNTDYKLIYAPDPWPQGLGGTSTLLGTGTSDVNGDLTIANTVDLGYDIPHPNDTNTTGGKIWLVLDSDHDGTEMTAWNPDDYLFEYNLITYDDTGP